VIDEFSEIEFNDLLEHIWRFYERTDDNKNKLMMLNALCRKTTLKQAVDALYSKVEKDEVFCGIMALCANNKLGL